MSTTNSNAFGRITVSPHALTYRGESLQKRDIENIIYREKSNIIVAILRNGFRLIMLNVILIGIPITIWCVYYDVKYCRVVMTMRKKGRNGRHKKRVFWVTPEESEFIQSRF